MVPGRLPLRIRAAISSEIVFISGRSPTRLATKTDDAAVHFVFTRQRSEIKARGDERLGE